jgi:hypothetical protein
MGRLTALWHILHEIILVEKYDGTRTYAQIGEVSLMVRFQVGNAVTPAATGMLNVVACQYQKRYSQELNSNLQPRIEANETSCCINQLFAGSSKTRLGDGMVLLFTVQQVVDE